MTAQTPVHTTLLVSSHPTFATVAVMKNPVVMEAVATEVVAMPVATILRLVVTAMVEVAMTVHVPLMRAKGVMAVEMKAAVIE